MGRAQNLFHEGLAAITDDPKAVMAALAKPGVVLRRAAGSNDPFSENPGLPAVRGVKRAKAAKAAGQQKLPLPKPERKPPDRKKLDAAEAAWPNSRPRNAGCSANCGGGAPRPKPKRPAPSAISPAAARTPRIGSNRSAAPMNVPGATAE